MNIHREWIKMKNSKGFTLVEVLIVVAIFAIGAAIAIPNIMDMGKRSSVRSAARQLKDQMAKARFIAIEQNKPVLIAFNPFVNGECNGYQIVQDTNGDSEIDAGESKTTVSLSGASITANNLTTNTAGVQIIQWDTRGLPRQKNGAFTAGTISFSGAGSQIDVVLSSAGNIRINKP